MSDLLNLQTEAYCRVGIQGVHYMLLLNACDKKLILRRIAPSQRFCRIGNAYHTPTHHTPTLTAALQLRL
jgi:hypothetical protein